MGISLDWLASQSEFSPSPLQGSDPDRLAGAADQVLEAENEQRGHRVTRSPRDQAQLSTFVVAVERVPSHLSIAVVTAYMWAVVDVSFPTLDHEVSAR